MNKFLIYALLTTILSSGCTTQYRLDLVSRDNGHNGNGVADENGKKISINLNGKTYTGTYVYDGTKVIRTTSSATSSAYSGTTSAIAFGDGYSSTYIPGSGNGKVLATSGNDSIRCDFNFNSGTGIGYCQDNRGKKFDLLIR